MNAAALAECNAKAFERRYREQSDPWNFAGSEYERHRYRTLLSNLSREHYRRVFEPGCSVGVLTEELAQRSDAVVATEISPTALARARERCAHLDNVEFQLSSVNDGLPEGTFDLIVFSEIGYYFTPGDLELMAERLGGALESGGEIIAVHWLGHSDHHVLHGDMVHALLDACLPFPHMMSERHEGFQLDRWNRA
jgi:SAM-dependent methyltransferase